MTTTAEIIVVDSGGPEPQIIEVGIPGAQGAVGLLEIDDNGNTIIVPVGRIDFYGGGFAVSQQSGQTARVELDLSDVAAGGELGGTLDAPIVDALHSGSTHQSLTDNLNAHLVDVVDSHDASAISFTPSGEIVSADVQSAIVEALADAEVFAAASAQDALTLAEAYADSLGGTVTIDGDPADQSHTTNTTEWNAISGTARMVVVWDSVTGRARWDNISAIDVFEPSRILGFTVNPIGSYPDGANGLALVASSGTDTPHFTVSYEGTPTLASIDIASHTYGGGRSPEVSGSDYPASLSSPYTSLNGPAINRGRAVGEQVTFHVAATIDGNSRGLNVALSYANERMWGVSSNAAIDLSGEIDTFRTAQSKELSNSRVKTFTVNAGTGEYLYYVLRSALGVPTFSVGGFDGGFGLIATVSWTNARGFAENFQVWRSDNPSLGVTTVEVS